MRRNLLVNEMLAVIFIAAHLMTSNANQHESMYLNFDKLFMTKARFVSLLIYFLVII